MTTPRDAIGLSDRLRDRLGSSRTVTVGPGLYEDVSEAAAALDALQARVEEYQSLAKELSDALLTVRPLGGSELFVKRFGQYYADPVYCKAAIEQRIEAYHEAMKESVRNRKRAEKAEQERDEAYEERDALVRDYQRINAQLAVEIAKKNGSEVHPRVKDIRRLAVGTEKEGK